MNQLKKFLNNLKYLLPAFGKYKKYSFIAIFSTFFETVMEVLVPIFMAKVLDDGILKQNMSLTLTYGIIMVIISLLAMASGLMATRYTGISSVGFGYNLRNLQYAKIQTFGFEDIEKFSTPSLITRMTGDIQQIIMSCFMIMRFLVKSPIMIIVTVIITINVNASLSMVFFATAPILALYVIFIAIKTIPGFTMFRSQFDNINLTVEENLANIRLIKSLVRQKKETNKFKEESKKMFNVGNIVFGRLSSLNAFSSFVLFLTTVLILLFGGNEIIKGRMGVGELTGFITYSMMLLMSLIMMSNLLVQIIASSASITRVSEVLKHETKLKDDKASDENKVIDGSVDFENVFFKYEEDSKNYALSGVNLHIKSGEKIGILGETGSSKSTLVQLIPRLYD
ncbi:ABC transporter transmembrane domain-containing protein, partial [Fusobacterium gastrosuis]|uniref:ABC transporter transmembrane domain-containing protein n=1 Tax=Fusobacterium gastrosuis TaxID=1755100 RepID=UPI0029757AA9|nr:ABC transporter ATP-binding protein [Fusobacteriaceae bacterium]MDY5713877.1 ABC transporter ATP-binding protein [Fusobacterium gastrosuis]